MNKYNPDNQTCKDFEKERCSRLDKSPCVCNGCPERINHCTIAHKNTYNARFSERKYREKRSDSRAGINLTKHELRKKDRIISSLIEQGQSPYQIVTNHPELDLSVRTVYSHLDQGLFTAKNVDLKRKVKFKPQFSTEGKPWRQNPLQCCTRNHGRKCVKCISA